MTTNTELQDAVRYWEKLYKVRGHEPLLFQAAERELQRAARELKLDEAGARDKRESVQGARKFRELLTKALKRVLAETGQENRVKSGLDEFISFDKGDAQGGWHEVELPDERLRIRLSWHIDDPTQAFPKPLKLEPNRRKTERRTKASLKWMNIDRGVVVTDRTAREQIGPDKAAKAVQFLLRRPRHRRIKPIEGKNGQRYTLVARGTEVRATNGKRVKVD